jgi:2'-5' RNA ligase
MRLFVAVVMPDSVRGALAAAVERLRPRAAGVAWVANPNLHVTLKFLGEVDEARLPAVQGALRRAVAGLAPFEVRVRALGAFPTPARPRVLWAGIADAGGRLGALARRVDEALGGAGFPREARPYAGHITLGRVREPRGDPALAAALAEAAHLDFGAVQVTHVVLMRSELSRCGARHSPVESWGLADG